MLLKHNAKSESDISSSQADEWLKNNPHRKAENMTGKLASDEVIRKISRSTSNTVVRTNKIGLVDKAGRKMNPTAERYTKTFNAIESALLDVKVLTRNDFNGYSDPIIFKMIGQLRSKGLDVLTLARANKAVGWCLASTLLNTQQTNQKGK